MKKKIVKVHPWRKWFIQTKQDKSVKDYYEVAQLKRLNVKRTSSST